MAQESPRAKRARRLRRTWRVARFARRENLCRSRSALVLLLPGGQQTIFASTALRGGTPLLHIRAPRVCDARMVRVRATNIKTKLGNLPVKHVTELSADKGLRAPPRSARRSFQRSLLRKPQQISPRRYQQRNQHRILRRRIRRCTPQRLLRKAQHFPQRRPLLLDLTNVCRADWEPKAT